MDFSDRHDPALFDFYLQLLKVDRSRPDLAFLTRLVRAHLDRFPFENISKLLYMKREGLKGLTGLRRYLDGAATHHFGGTCYSSNYYLHLLLTHLGFKVKLCGADMNRPDVHVVTIVTVEGREFLVDVGYAAPFLDPMPLDLTDDYRIRLAEDHYHLRPRDQNDRWRLEMHRNGEIIHGYLVNPLPRTIDHFAPAILDSYRPAGTFMTSLLLTRFSPGRSARINNMSVRLTNGQACQTHEMKTSAELFDAIEEHFGIPAAITAEALEGLDLTGNTWS
ncbi:MAG: arylamine N-acetyltransferase [candidate division Zixibacteria bacterium]|nr:arylamine N-acetyltransferase [candidate division Zixibacteria bacterium]